jgi:hypothetical protein
MEDKKTAEDILLKVENLTNLVDSLEDKTLKKRVASSLAKTRRELRDFISFNPADDSSSGWDSFSYDKERCIAP